MESQECVVITRNSNTDAPESGKSDDKIFNIRLQRCKARLTDKTYSSLFKDQQDTNPLTRGKFDFIVERFITVLKGNLSQFDNARTSTGHLLPVMTGDCCQTFSSVCAVILASTGSVENLRPFWQPSTVNYILYSSAWLHQITSAVWGEAKLRPNVRDLNALLKFKDVFPAYPDDAFDVLFYNDITGVRTRIKNLCCNPKKRPRSSEDDETICGYLIVSGDFTVSLVCVPHDGGSSYALILCDSHGTPLWSGAKASFLLVNVSDGLSEGSWVELPNKSRSFDLASGCEYFCDILCVLLEDNRKESWMSLQKELIGEHVGEGRRLPPVPYMTWTPIKRNVNRSMTLQETKIIIDTKWLPLCLSNPAVLKEKSQHFSNEEFLRPCFLGT